MSNEIAEQESHIDSLLALKESIERDLWLYRALTKGGEAIAFATMFGLFGKDPTMYKAAVVLGVVCIITDFALSYHDYKTHKEFEKKIGG